MATTIVNFRDVKQHWLALSKKFDNAHLIYIGRRNRRYGLPDSPWHNPWHVGEPRADGSTLSRADAIAWYRVYITERISSGQLNIEELRGKTLVCWCAPKSCHGDILLQLLGE